MNECERICNLFWELQEQQLDSNTERIVKEHLHNCTCCREDLKWYGITVKALINLDSVAPPEDFLAQLRSRLYSSPTPSSYLQYFKNLLASSPYMPLPVGVSALALIVVLGFVVYNNAPNPVTPQTTTAQSSLDSVVRSSALASSTSGSTGHRQSDKGGADRFLARGLESTSSNPSGPLTSYAMSAPRPLGESVTGRPLPTVADVLGADNLTVESRSTKSAVESLKKMLPNIEGRLVHERSQDGIDETILAVLIPSTAYSRLTTELIKHGTVAAGAGSGALPPTRSTTDNNSVVLYIRFVNSH